MFRFVLLLLLLLFLSPSCYFFRSIMETTKVIGPSGLAPITLQRLAEIRITTEVIYKMITNSNMISLEESAHAPIDVRNKARADRLAGVHTVSASLTTRRFTQMGFKEPKLYDASKDIELAMQAKKVCLTLPNAPNAPISPHPFLSPPTTCYGLLH